MGKKRQNRAKALVPALTATFLLLALAQVLVNQHQQAQQDLIERFRARGQTGAHLISAYITDVGRREADLASRKLADPQPSRQAFDSVVESFGFEAAVLLDQDGRVIHVFPDSPQLVGQNLTQRREYGHLSRALAGSPAVSNVVPSAARAIPILGIAVPYETAHGRRVFSGAFAIGASPLDQFVKNLLPYAASVYMIDSGGKIAASTVPIAEPFTPLGRQDPALYQSFRFGFAEPYVSGGERHVPTLNEIPNTSWRLVMSVPEIRLLQPLNELRWVPWLVYAGLVLASAIACVLLMRLWQREAQLRQERLRLQEQLEEELRLNKALDEFAGRVAHDLRNPLGNALVATQMAAKHQRDGTMLAKWLDTAQGQVRRGIDLTQGMLDLAKAAGTPRRELVDLNEVVAELAKEIEGIHVESENLPRIEADKLAVRQALANLMENAGRYARNNGTARVAVRADLEQTACTITVEDEGPGLNPEDAMNIFRPFHRGKSQEIPGTGLGLAIVATAAKAHGGNAWYEPRPGGGSLFRISIPQTSSSARSVR